MSQLLLSELSQLASETKRKQPDVRSAAEAALAALRADEQAVLAATRSAPAGTRAGDVPLLRPILMACEAKGQPKGVGIALALLQRMLGMRIVPEAALPELADMITGLAQSRSDIEIHLKLLQCVSGLLAAHASIHGELLSRVLLVCFRLQESKVAVVSSTAAATLRQAVMTVFDKVRDEDAVLAALKGGDEDAAAAAPLACMTIEVPGGEDVTLFPCSRDAYSVIDDLNSLASGKSASFLALASLPRTFALELIESILTNHASLFRPATHPELLLCLRQSTGPLLIRSLSETASFPTTLRLMRLLFVLLRHFSAELRVEVEILMSILLRLLAPAATSESAEGQHPVPPWQRVLAMEVARSLCQDGELLRNFWRWYDGSDSSASVFTGLVDALHRLSIENPGLIGRADAAEQMSGPETPGSRASTDKAQPARSGFYQAARGVLAGASEAGAGLGLSQTSVPGVQLLDQLDKIEAPAPPPTYIYLLALQSLTHLSQSIASFVLPAYSSYINATPSLAGRAPPALDLDTYAGPKRDELLLLRSMIQQAWPLLLASFTFFLSAKCDDVLFSEVLVALRNFTNTTGVLSLTAPRDALIASLARFAVPRTVLNRLEEARRASREDESSGSASFVALSERNAACLKAITHISYYLSGSLAWRDILETLCEAEYVLRLTGSRRRKGAASSEGPEDGAYSPRASMASFASLSTIAAGFQSGTALDPRTKKPAAMSGLDTETLLADIARVFENTGALDQSALTGFLQALVALVADVTGASPADKPPRRRNSTSAAAPLARFASTQRSFAITSLELVAMLNVARLAVAEPVSGWDIVVSQLIDVFSDNVVRAVLRVQASEALDSFLLASMGVRDAKLDAARVQKQVLHALAKQAVLQPHRSGSTDLEVRKLALEALLRILEAHGHELTTGWETIFHACSSACAGSGPEAEEGAAAAGSVASSRGSMPLIKAGFASLQLVCSDLLSSLTLAQLELCASTLTLYSKQTEDINVALTANGTLWAISAELSSRSDQGADALAPLWTHLLRSLQSVSADSRAEVRNGAISNLFRVLEQYGSTLDVRTWSEVILPEILYPLLSTLYDAARAAAAQTTTPEQQDQLAATMGTPQSAVKQWNESRVLAWTSLGRMVAQYLVDKMSVADNFEALWRELLQRAQQAFLEGTAPVSQAAMLALHGIASVDAASANGALQPAWDALWRVLTEIGRSLQAAEGSLTQANLLAYVQTVQVVYGRLADELEPARLDAMLTCLKDCVTYSRCPDQQPDVDALTPVQAAVRNFLKTMRVPAELRSRLLTDLAEYSTLAFTVAPVEHTPGVQRRQPTYVALHRASAQDALERFDAFKGSLDVYSSGALDAVFVSLMLPIKLKYDCPAPSRHAKEPPRPLWQSATITFCKIARGCCLALQEHGEELPDEHVQALWRQIVAVFEAALAADNSLGPVPGSEAADRDEVFDLLLLATLEQDILPFLGGPRVPRELIASLCEALARASSLFVSDAAPEQDARLAGSVAPIATTPREHHAYWTLDLLFLMCSDRWSEYLPSRQRVAAIALPVLLRRCSSSLEAYAAHAPLWGMAAAPRVRDEELVYLLSSLLDLHLWPGSMAQAEPEQPRPDGSGSSALRDLVQQSPRGHLFALHPVLCALLAMRPPAGAPSPAPALAGTSRQLSVPVRLPEHLRGARVGTANPLGSARLERAGAQDAQALLLRLLRVLGDQWR